ncbi:type IV toxin-antitoxin system AbiEi family antitoxin domain-containing protein [Cellulosimicrobium cellulans]|uniref:type IV toxin-antitoxin system AbiEi family antitoxin domain-containing protein n=1 Tax=Cellulosimicrobium cellulans TaxID=1710 RepID=UPI0024075161|nr:hypothetical protein [Cellulosimicrobium cellulans]MDF9874886.1 putative transcriptional regulator of viral defense system [Cellulosimicrobium cellulans]
MSAAREHDQRHEEAIAVTRWSEVVGSGLSAGKAHQVLTDPTKYERIGHGLYRSLDLPPVDTDLVEIAARAPKATLCLTSALAWHGLTDEIPMTYDLAVARGTRPPALHAGVTFHRFDAATYSIGREPHPLPDEPDLTIWVYSSERTIADLFRLPHRRDEAIAATKQWLRGRGHTPARLLEVGRQLPRTEKALRNALSVLA